MKKTIILTLILTMLALPAIGESIDLSTIGFADLIELRDRVDVELKTRPEYEEKGYGGVLIGGKTIKVGAYEFVCLADIELNQWSNEDEYANDKSACVKSSRDMYGKGDVVLIYFDEGTVINILDGTVLIRPAAADWVPKTE